LVSEMSEARRMLRDSVRGAWDTKEPLIRIQDELTRKGYEIAHDAFRECLKTGTEPVQKCYAAKGDELSEAYRSIWGAK